MKHSDDPADPLPWMQRGFEFPKTHSLVRLMDILESGGISIPPDVKSADILTQYAVQTRYPGWAEEISQAEYLEAIRLASLVVTWGDSILIEDK